MFDIRQKMAHAKDNGSSSMGGPLTMGLKLGLWDYFILTTEFHDTHIHLIIQNSIRFSTKSLNNHCLG